MGQQRGEIIKITWKFTGTTMRLASKGVPITGGGACGKACHWTHRADAAECGTGAWRPKLHEHPSRSWELK